MVAVRTDMPGVTPQMWAWWFGWHGHDARYKLWHPRAHVSARWNDDGDDVHYVGRTSLVEEFLGSEFARLSIRFVAPSSLGLGAAATNGAVAICARTGSGDLPVDVGWIVHYVRPHPRWRRDALPILARRPTRCPAIRYVVGRQGATCRRGPSASRSARPDGALRPGEEPPCRLSARAVRAVRVVGTGYSSTMWTTRRLVQTPPAEVWRVLTDLDEWPKWGPTVRRAELDDGDLLTLGVSGRVWTPVGVALPFTITEFVPGISWGWRVAGVPATRHGVDPDGRGCRVWMSAPLWAPAYLPVLAVAVRRIEQIAT